MSDAPKKESRITDIPALLAGVLALILAVRFGMWSRDFWD
jgi:hypothetical protein